MKRHPLNSVVPFLLPFLVAAGLMLLCGCSSVKPVETWHKPATPGSPFRKLMVVGIGHDESLRAEVENILVAELGRNGVEAVPSHSFVKEIDTAGRDDIVAAVRATGADAVLTIRPVARGTAKVTQGGESGGIYGTAGNAGGSLLTGARTYERAMLQGMLYDRATEELVWSATVSTSDAGNTARVSRELARFFLENLRRDGFLSYSAGR